MVTIFSLDSIPKEVSTICWTQGKSTEPLPAFLSQNAPSTSKSSTDGWVWVRSARKYQSKIPKELDELDASTDSLETLAQTERELVALKEDKTRAKKGEKTKKQKIDDVNQNFGNRMRAIGQSAHLTCGKWLFFEDADNVDSVFGVLANSIIDGPLSKLDVCVHTVKAADAQQAAPGESGNRVICLYFEDCWNESHAKEVLKCLLGQHNMSPSACKPDLYTAIDLTSGRASGIRASLFTSNALIPEAERKKLRAKAEKEFGLDSKGRKIIKAAKNNKMNEDDYDSTTSSEAEEEEVEEKSKSKSKSSSKKFQAKDSDYSGEEVNDSKWEYQPKATNSRSKKVEDSKPKNKASTSNAGKPKSKLARELAELNDDSSEDEGIKRGGKQLKRGGDSSASDNASKKKGSGALNGKKKDRSASITEDSVTEEE